VLETIRGVFFQYFYEILSVTVTVWSWLLNWLQGINFCSEILSGIEEKAVNGPMWGTLTGLDWKGELSGLNDICIDITVQFRRQINLILLCGLVASVWGSNSITWIGWLDELKKMVYVSVIKWSVFYPVGFGKKNKGIINA